ncbi:hypothetical protein SDC9_156416 [bioreactor metagenome]|uniref:Uncharacterized protein n=1 Tax=bioreactor metagenome TaxID=1076179 RepID=A0A645F450_9ZZZZ
MSHAFSVPFHADTDTAAAHQLQQLHGAIKRCGDVERDGIERERAQFASVVCGEFQVQATRRAPWWIMWRGHERAGAFNPSALDADGQNVHGMRRAELAGSNLPG